MYRAAAFLSLLSACLAATDLPIVEDCGPADAYIKFNNLEIEPHPFNILGTIRVKANVTTGREIGTSIGMKVVIKKSQFNGGFTWQVPCTNVGWIGDAAGVEGITGYFGTCEYKGSCDFPLIKTWTTEGCPAFFKENKIPCSCPFPPRHFSTDGWQELDLSGLKDRLPTWLVAGGYHASVELIDTANNDKMVGCFKFNIEVSDRKACPAALQKWC